MTVIILLAFIQSFLSYLSPHVRKSKTVWDSLQGSTAVDSEFQILDSGCLVSETWIQDFTRSWDF